MKKNNYYNKLIRMSSLIKKQIYKFNNEIVNYFKKEYDLNIVKDVYNLKKTNELYYKNSIIILHNTILNKHYKTKLDEDKYSFLYILYKNLHYTNFHKIKQDYDKIKLDKFKKENIVNDFSKYKDLDFLSKTIFIIGRKYINDKNNNITNNSLGKLISLSENNLKNNSIGGGIVKNSSVGTSIVKNSVDNKVSKSNLRRLFLYNLKQEFEKNKVSTLYIKNHIKQGLFLDTEYTNDIYDDFKTFPISYNSSFLFMIGITYMDKNEKLLYKNFMVDRLNKDNEILVIKDFFNYLENFEDKIVIYYWSNADKNILEKSIKRYSELYDIYIKKFKEKIIYIDLLPVFKKTIYSESYSLKYISKQLLNKTYDSECQNGLDAMCSIIENDILLNNIYNVKSSLKSFDSTHDVVKYNKIDTELLYYLMKYILS